MNGILGRNTLLLDTALSQEQRASAAAIRESAEALLVVINDILDVSKLEAGKIKIETIDFDLAEIVENAAGLLMPTAHGKGLALEVAIDPAARRGFRGDPTRIRQVVLNLLSNAVKFTEQGRVATEVSARAEADGRA